MQIVRYPGAELKLKGGGLSPPHPPIILFFYIYLYIFFIIIWILPPKKYRISLLDLLYDIMVILDFKFIRILNNKI